MKILRFTYFLFTQHFYRIVFMRPQMPYDTADNTKQRQTLHDATRYRHDIQSIDKNEFSTKTIIGMDFLYLL